MNITTNKWKLKGNTIIIKGLFDEINMKAMKELFLGFSLIRE